MTSRGRMLVQISLQKIIDRNKNEALTDNINHKQKETEITFKQYADSDVSSDEYDDDLRDPDWVNEKRKLNKRKDISDSDSDDTEKKSTNKTKSRKKVRVKKTSPMKELGNDKALNDVLDNTTDNKENKKQIDENEVTENNDTNVNAIEYISVDNVAIDANIELFSEVLSRYENEKNEQYTQDHVKDNNTSLECLNTDITGDCETLELFQEVLRQNDNTTYDQPEHNSAKDRSSTECRSMNNNYVDSNESQKDSDQYLTKESTPTEIETKQMSSQETIVNDKPNETTQGNNRNDNDSECTSLQHDINDETIQLIEEIISEENGVNALNKKKSDPSKWEKNIQKLNRMKGKQYKGAGKSDSGKQVFCVERNERVMADRTCSKRCEKSRMCFEISQDQRAEIFQTFWANMTWQEKKMYVQTLVHVSVPQYGKEGTRKTKTFKYNLKHNGAVFSVCKELFLATLGIGEKMMYNWLNETQNAVLDESDNAVDTHMQITIVSDKMKSAQEFLLSLPTVPSHYCRATSSKTYLEPHFRSFSDLYRFYKTQSEQPVAIKSFRRVFKLLNFGLYQPRKDQCDVCCAYKIGNIIEGVYGEHIRRKTEARNEMQRDIEISVNNEEIKVITMDVQSVLLCPKTNASALYYKTKLACHNFTVYDTSTKDVCCYFWHEGEFGLTADAFATCIVDYLTVLINKGAKEIIIYSDGCCYQNRNTTMANALLLVSQRFDVTITQKYLEKGHTQMTVDSVHSTIERRIRGQDIYVPSNYVEQIQKARKDNPYRVKYLKHDFFKAYSKIKLYNSIRPGVLAGDAVVTDLRVLRYNPVGNIQYKLHYGDDFADVPKKHTRQVLSEDHVVEQAAQERAPIKSTKYNHLQQLKAVIPSDYHGFYDNLLFK